MTQTKKTGQTLAALRKQGYTVLRTTNTEGMPGPGLMDALGAKCAFKDKSGPGWHLCTYGTPKEPTLRTRLRK